MEIFVEDIPTISVAGPSQTICISTGNAVMAANSPIVGTGLWTLVSGSGSIITPTSPSTNIFGLGVGTNVFAWTISNAPCASSSSTLAIEVKDLPTNSNAGPTQTLCISNPNTTGPRLLDLGGATRTFNITSGTTTITPSIENGGVTKSGSGILVVSVEDGSPAKRAGLAERDVIVRYGEHPVAGIDDLHRLLIDEAVGVRSTLSVLRGAELLTLIDFPQQPQDTQDLT